MPKNGQKSSRYEISAYQPLTMTKLDDQQEDLNFMQEDIQTLFVREFGPRI
jgi:hypothetical protein